MKKIFILLIISVLSLNMCVYANTKDNNNNYNSSAATIQKTNDDIIIKNKLFSFKRNTNLTQIFPGERFTVYALTSRRMEVPAVPSVYGQLSLSYQHIAEYPLQPFD